MKKYLLILPFLFIAGTAFAAPYSGQLPESLPYGSYDKVAVFPRPNGGFDFWYYSGAPAIYDSNTERVFFDGSSDPTRIIKPSANAAFINQGVVAQNYADTYFQDTDLSLAWIPTSGLNVSSALFSPLVIAFGVAAPILLAFLLAIIAVYVIADFAEQRAYRAVLGRAHAEERRTERLLNK